MSQATFLAAAFLLPTVFAVSYNPYQRGCMYTKNLTKKVRVCNSDDEVGSTNCRHPTIGYPEIRLIPQDWESVMFSSWILQILLSEILDVPTTLEMGDTQSQLNFYHPDSPFDYPVTENYMDALEETFLLKGDCSQANRLDPYQGCGHFVPEVWGGSKRDVQDMVRRDVIEPPLNVGQLAQEGWFVPKFTALRDPTLLSYLGYQGEENRPKMAERFQRPTTWTDYCEEVSPNNCTRPDTVAQRAPLHNEHDKMFAENLYTGHFRITEKGNCTLNPTTCTGHFADYPCDWRSPVPGQLYHLGIPLDPGLGEGGYSYSQLVEIWRAANATKSDVVLFWWRPQLLYGEFQLTDAAFTRVTLPTTTQSCVEARVDSQFHCSSNQTLQVGSPEGICMEPPQSLSSIMSSTVYEQTYQGGDLAEHSPSHQALSNYKLSALQIEEIMIRWNEQGDPREALCGWVADNMEYMEAFIPRSFPRTFEGKGGNGPLLYASTFIGAFCMVLVIITFVAVQQQRDRRVIKYAQIEFLNLLLAGAFLISLGAIVMAAPSSNATCIVAVWTVHIGYTLELVPLIVKIGAVLHVMNSGKKMKRATIQRHMLFGVVALLCFLMIIYLIVWTAIDPPQVTAEYEVTSQQKDDGETIVWVLDVCASKSEIWWYISLGWNVLLLLVTTVLAIRMRKLNVKGFCETSTLALLVYSHFFFVILRVIAMLSASGGHYAVAYYRSIIFSADTMATIAIYFVPKFLAQDVGASLSLSIGENVVSGIALNRLGGQAMPEPSESELSLQPNEGGLSLHEPTSVISNSGQGGMYIGGIYIDGISGSRERLQEPTGVESFPQAKGQETSAIRLPEAVETESDAEVRWDEDETTALLKQRIEELQHQNASLEAENEVKTSRLYALEEELSLLKKDRDNKHFEV